MKTLAFAVAVLALCSAQALAQHGGPRGAASLALEGGKVAVDYGRPAVKGRDIQTMITPGAEWRLGANAATTLTTDVGLKFGDKAIPAGTYVLKAKYTGGESWSLLVQKADQTTVAEVPLTFKKADTSAELLTIDLAKAATGGTLVVHWGTLTLSAPFTKA